MKYIFMKKRIFMFMVQQNFRLLQTKFSYFSVIFIIILNSPLINCGNCGNCGNFFDVNDESINLSLKNQNVIKNNIQLTNSSSDLELLDETSSDIKNEEKNTSENVILTNIILSGSKHLSNYKQWLNTFDNLKNLYSNENNLQKYFHCYDHNYKFYHRTNKKVEIKKNGNTQFDLNIESKEDLYKITENLIKLIKKDFPSKKYMKTLDKSLVEQQKIQSDFKNINLEQIKSLIGLINGLRQFKNRNINITISSHEQAIKFYNCFVKPLYCLKKYKISNYKYLENFCRKFADSYIFLKKIRNKRYNFSYENIKIDQLYLRNVYKGSLDDLSHFEKKINKILANTNFTKEDLTKALQKIFKDEKLYSLNYVNDLKKLSSDCKNKYCKLNHLRSNIIKLCFILINNILDHNDYLEYKISETIINYIYIYSILCNIQCFKKIILSKATRDVIDNFDNFNNHSLKCIMEYNSNIKHYNLQNIRKRIIQNKKRLTIFNYFLDFYIKLITIKNDTSILDLITHIETEITILISNRCGKLNK